MKIGAPRYSCWMIGVISLNVCRATVFDHVRIPAAPDIELQIRVEPAEGMEGTRLEVRKLTMPKAPDLPNDAERWRAAGLKPDGKPLDPKHLQ